MAKASVQAPYSKNAWSVQISTDWDVLGPFPIQAREQHFLSPAFPLNLSEQIDYTRTWPSSYADGGAVSWSKAQSTEDGALEVSFPHIRWKSLRAFEGWAALQHHAVLRTILKVSPPDNIGADTSVVPQLRVRLNGGSYFTLLPIQGQNTVPMNASEWYAGNIYGIENDLPRVVNFPSPPSQLSSTEYEMFISGDYEIRLFGDPVAQNKGDAPVLSINVQAEIENKRPDVVHESTQDVICDFVDGYSFGDAVGIGIRSISNWWTVTNVAMKKSAYKESQAMQVKLVEKVRIAPSQMRIVPVSIVQDDRYNDANISLEITLTSEDCERNISVSLMVKHHKPKTATTIEPIAIRGSYFYAQSMPTMFLAVPPLLHSPNGPHPPVLALHGAGVDIFSEPFWAASLPKNKYKWTVIPSGRTPWGLDWHGPSAKEAWASLDALVSVLERDGIWDFQKLVANISVVLIGHSNGGQGAWYMASRFPDRVLGVVPASGYIKSQSYVPNTLSRSLHFIDPSLRAVLDSSLTPDDNDLHLSNLADTPILAIHGGDDENVPVWHTREALGLIKSWSQAAEITLKEDPGRGHWYPSVLNNPQVQDFIDFISPDSSRLWDRTKSFTLTVSVPQESGTLRGWKIEKLIIPGRLGRIHVKPLEDKSIRVETSNVLVFSVNRSIYDLGFAVAEIDDSSLEVSETSEVLLFETRGFRTWEIASRSQTVQGSSRAQSILTTPGPLVIVVSEEDRGLSMALRIAHDLNLYHKIDAKILLEEEALTVVNTQSWSRGNIVFIGTSNSEFVRRTLQPKKTPLTLQDSNLILNGRRIGQDGRVSIFLQPHPSHPESSMLLMLYTDLASLERGGRLFPIRTGVTVPNWICVSDLADSRSAAGVEGAGVWGTDWSWNEQLSWLY